MRRECLESFDPLSLETLGIRVLPAPVPVGTPFSGSFTFDDSPVAGSPYGSSGGFSDLYSFGEPEFRIHSSLGGNAIEEAPPGPSPLLPWSGLRPGYSLQVGQVVTDGSDPDRYQLQVQIYGSVHSSSAAPEFDALDSLSPYLATEPGSAPFPAGDLAAIPWDLSALPISAVRWNFTKDGTVGVEGTLDSLSIAPVPEPPASALVALGTVALAWLGFRRARSWCILTADFARSQWNRTRLTVHLQRPFFATCTWPCATLSTEGVMSRAYLVAVALLALSSPRAEAATVHVEFRGW